MSYQERMRIAQSFKERMLNASRAPVDPNLPGEMIPEAAEAVMKTHLRELGVSCHLNKLENFSASAIKIQKGEGNFRMVFDRHLTPSQRIWNILHLMGRFATDHAELHTPYVVPELRARKDIPAGLLMDHYAADWWVRDSFRERQFPPSESRNALTQALVDAVNLTPKPPFLYLAAHKLGHENHPLIKGALHRFNH